MRQIYFLFYINFLIKLKFFFDKNKELIIENKKKRKL